MKNILLLISLVVSASAQPTFASGSKVKLGGYCAVAYVGAQKALFGNPDFASDYEGSSYYFINKDAKAMFDKEPTKFVNGIKYDAWCATGVALGKKLATDPKLFSEVDGKVYLFSSADAKAMFDKDKNGMIKKAESSWPKLNK